jgi:hypothetical protein
MPLLNCVIGDEAAPFHHGVAEKITPKQGGKQFSEFEKFIIGVRDKDGDYLFVTSTSKAAIQFKDLLKPGRYYTVVNNRVNTQENPKCYSPTLVFSIDLNKAVVTEYADPPMFRNVVFKNNITMILSKNIERKVDICGKVVNEPGPRPKKEGSTDMVATVCLMDKSKHLADTSHWDASAHTTPKQGQTVVLTNVLVKVTGDLVSGLWLSESGKSKRHVMPAAFAMDDVDISDTTTCKKVAALLIFQV